MASQELSKLLAKFLEDADKPGTIAEAIKVFVLMLKGYAELHAQSEAAYADAEKVDGKTCRICIEKSGLCAGGQVMRILDLARNRSDPMFEGMDMVTKLQIMQGASAALHMVK